MEIAVLGLGRMGSTIATRLLEAGNPVVVWNRSRERAAPLVDKGARSASSIPEAVAEVDVALTSLANDQAVREVMLGADGVLASLMEGGVAVDCSTVSATLSAELESTAGPGRFAAMPVLGAPQVVADGKGTWLIGGSDAVANRLRPVVDELRGHSVRFRTAAAASVAKVSSNLLLLAGIAALAEAVATGRAGGLSDEELHALLDESPAVAPALHNRFAGVLTGRQETWWSAALGAKDLGLAREVARSGGVELRLAPVAEEEYEKTAATEGEVDVVAITHRYRPGVGG